MNKSTMLECLINHYSDGVKAHFARLIGITPQNLSKWLNSNTFNAETLFRSCPGISAEWLLSGEGNMLNCTHNHTVNNLSVATNSNYQHGTIANQISTPNDSILQELATLRERVNSLQQIIAEKERLIKLYESINNRS